LNRLLLNRLLPHFFFHILIFFRVLIFHGCYVSANKDRIRIVCVAHGSLPPNTYAKRFLNSRVDHAQDSRKCEILLHARKGNLGCEIGIAVIVIYLLLSLTLLTDDRQEMLLLVDLSESTELHGEKTICSNIYIYIYIYFIHTWGMHTRMESWRKRKRKSDPQS